MMGLRLIGKRLLFEVDRPRSLGRSNESSIQVLDMKVSREHCVVEPLGPGVLRIRDLSSRNGTYVNGRRVKEVSIALPGEEIAVGPFRFLVEDDSREEDVPMSSAAAITPRRR